MEKEKKPPRGERMDPERKKKIEKTEPIKAMKICGPIALGDQNIVSKCLLAIQVFKEQHTGEKELEKALRHHLYKDIERLLIVRRANKEREYAQQSRRLQKELNKVTPRTLRQTRSASF
jgi:hypothetical protein